MNKPIFLLPALALLWGCSGTLPSAGKTTADSPVPAVPKAPALAQEEEILFSEVVEFVNLGQESIKDSLWFQAGQDFDSALVHLAALEATDSLSPTVLTHIGNYRDSVQKLLIFTVAMTSQMSEPVPWTAQFDEEMEEVPDSSVQAMDSIVHGINPRDYELPLTSPLEPRILQAMSVFTGPGRGYFTKWLTRKSRYQGLVEKKLKERGMPKDLLYLAMVESGFNPKAWSKASASGMWQFISGTGRRYGLKDDWWYDPRRDPVLATDAALEYLNDLHEEFQDWHMAMAAYNCGEGRIRRLLIQDSTRGYWDMPLPKETRFYVPKILAAMIIGHNPERYGFKIDQPEAPLAFDTVTVTHCLTIATIAKSAGVSEDTVVSYNPSLRRWCTPPNRVSHILYLPAGSGERFRLAYEKMDKSSLVNWRRHIVTSGQTLSGIAARYHVSVAAIKATNKMKGHFIRRGQSLLIPLAPKDAGKYLDEDVATSSSRGSKYKGGTYRVRSGDNLFDIARRFGTTVSALRIANHLRHGGIIRAGQRLKLTGNGPTGDEDESESHREPKIASVEIARPEGKRAGTPSAETPDRDGSVEASVSASATGKFGFYTVAAGETIYSISRDLGVGQEDLRNWNSIVGNHILVGQKLKYLAPGSGSDEGGDNGEETSSDDVATAGFEGGSQAKEKESRQYYVVKDGDTLWDISVRYRSTVQKLKDLNGRLPTVIKPGTRIRVK